MDSKFAGPSFSLALIEGRKFLYDLYAQKKTLKNKSELEEKVECFLSDFKWFEETRDLILNDGMPALYDRDIHFFSTEKIETGEADLLLAKRDFLVHRVSTLIQEVISPYEEEFLSQAKMLEDYVYSKLLKHTAFLSVKDFVDDASVEETEKACGSLLKLFNKIESGKFLSEKEKLAKSLSKQNDASSTEAPNALEPDVKVLHTSALPAEFSQSDLLLMLSSLIGKIEGRKLHSEDGKTLKEGALKELRDLHENLTSNKDISGIVSEYLFSPKMTNIVPDDVFLEIQALGEMFGQLGIVVKIKDQAELAAQKGAKTPPPPLKKNKSVHFFDEEPQQLPLSFKEENTPIVLPAQTKVTDSVQEAKGLNIEEKIISSPNEEQQIAFAEPLNADVVDEVPPEVKVETEALSTGRDPKPSAWSHFVDQMKSIFLKIAQWFARIWHKIFS